MRPADRFRIASVTKTFTAALIMLLVEDGELSLDDVVSEHVAGVPNGDEVTIRQLLQHTAGLGDYLFEPSIQAARGEEHTPADLLAVAQSLAPVHAPGARYQYSNTHYVLLGLIIQSVTSSTWASQVRERLLDPVGLTNTFVLGWEEVPGGFIHGYLPASGGGWDDVTLAMHPTVAYAAGCMVSSMPDLVRWSQALHAGRVVSPASIEAMQSDNHVSEMYPNLHIGLGLFIEDADEYGSFVGHAGGIDGFSSQFQLLDGPGHTVALAFNRTENESGLLSTFMNDAWIAVLGL